MDSVGRSPSGTNGVASDRSRCRFSAIVEVVIDFDVVAVAVVVDDDDCS